MAQVNVNFRLDEGIKRSMESACKEMGLSMTMAFTMFATKVGNERRIPFEITAGPAASAPGGELAELRELRDALELMFTRIRGALTGIVTVIPASACGMTVECVRLLCADTLKDQAAAALAALRSELSERKLPAARKKDERILARYQTELSALLAELETIEAQLLPLLTVYSGENGEALESYAQRLTSLSGQFAALQATLREFSASAAQRERSVQERIQRCAQAVSDPEVIAELRILEALVRRRYDCLDDETRSRVDSFYLTAVEHTVQELGRAECSGEDTTAGVRLCLRAIQVVSQTVATAGQMQCALRESDLESEVTALERFAALRGDITGEPSAF